MAAKIILFGCVLLIVGFRREVRDGFYFKGCINVNHKLLMMALMVCLSDRFVRGDTLNILGMVSGKI